MGTGHCIPSPVGMFLPTFQTASNKARAKQHEASSAVPSRPKGPIYSEMPLTHELAQPERMNMFVNLLP
eukprot:s877_g4.t1